MPKQLTQDDILNIAKAYQPTCVLTAAADLDFFSIIDGNPISAQSLCTKLNTDLRATTILLDSLVALNLLAKQGPKYSLPPHIAPLLTESSPTNILPVVRHHANCMRSWAQLAQVTQTSKPASHSPSIRGAAADQDAFIQAMHVFSQSQADDLVQQLHPLSFRHLLDIGGASGTWTIAFLRTFPHARATLFDLPEVIPLARKQIAQAGLTDRITFIPGDFYTDELPAGADFAWLSAIAHQNSSDQNRLLFTKIHQCLDNDGFLIMRDVVMDSSRTSPVAGSLFAVNMLVATEGGRTYTFDEYQHDLTSAGFNNIKLIKQDEFMNSLIQASAEKSQDKQI